jgi:hypothetical protein
VRCRRACSIDLLVRSGRYARAWIPDRAADLFSRVVASSSLAPLAGEAGGSGHCAVSIKLDGVPHGMRMPDVPRVSWPAIAARRRCGLVLLGGLRRLLAGRGGEGELPRATATLHGKGGCCSWRGAVLPLLFVLALWWRQFLRGWWRARLACDRELLFGDLRRHALLKG